MAARMITKLLAPLAYVSGASARRWRDAARDGQRTVVICYHRVVPDGDGGGLFGVERGLPASVFERQIAFLLRHFEPVPASRALEPGAPGRLRFAVTFDDGYGDNFSVAAPILKRLGVTATFFVVSDFVGTDRRFWWESVAAMLRRSTAARLDVDAVLQDGGTSVGGGFAIGTAAEKERAQDEMVARVLKLPHPAIAGVLARLSGALAVPIQWEERDFPLMGWDDLRALMRDGFEIGGHTATHCNLGHPDSLDLEREIVASNRRIEGELDTELATFAFPYGRAHHQSDAARSVIARTGAKLIFTTEKGVAASGGDRLGVPRLQLNRTSPMVWTHNLTQGFDAGA